MLTDNHVQHCDKQLAQTNCIRNARYTYLRELDDLHT